jgi:hypothetical protein
MIARVMLLLLLSVISVGERAPEVREDETAKSWTAPSSREVSRQVEAWLQLTSLDESEQQTILAQFTDQIRDEPSANILPAVLVAAQQAEPRVQDLVETLSQTRPLPLPPFPCLQDENVDLFLRHQLQLAYGEWLVRQRLYDEAAEQLEPLSVNDVVDPASLLFCQGVERFNKLQQEPALQVLTQLLEREANIPRRYAALAKLMQAELAPLEEDSLEHIARRMDDVGRRLDLGRPGKPTQEVEDGVVKSLDKMIDKLEQQRQQQQRQMARQSQAPFDPSRGARLPELKGPGDVTPKNVGDSSGWGDLPPKQREEAIQQIGKEFPAHYRDAIEQFFRNLATGGEEKSP